jgi:hypothetical protein
MGEIVRGGWIVDGIIDSHFMSQPSFSGQGKSISKQIKQRELGIRGGIRGGIRTMYKLYYVML